MKTHKIALLVGGRGAARAGERAGAHQPASEHDPGRGFRDARRAGPGRAGRRLHQEGRHAVSARVHGRRLRKRARLERRRSSKAKLATPIEEDGETIDTEVSQIVWTWTGPLGKVDNGQFINFPLSLAIPDDAAGKALEFRTVQTYSNGQVVHWIDPSLTAEHPSPRINVTAKGGVIEDIAGDEAGPAAGQTRRPALAASRRRPPPSRQAAGRARASASRR